ncbi:hypothetical protein [Burkholderia sp. S171]|uniref:hypothetical protein n=1 Tax=Burkholderia sp. S171 TaxID=1641860 RepID=UPI00131E7D84|nr:hypothetical protein [Burkholderia sp. S171]
MNNLLNHRYWMSSWGYFVLPYASPTFVADARERLCGRWNGRTTERPRFLENSGRFAGSAHLLHLHSRCIAGECTVDSADFTWSKDTSTPTPASFQTRCTSAADFRVSALADARFQPLCFYRKSDAKPVDSARQPAPGVRPYETCIAPRAPAGWFIVRDGRLSGDLLRRNKNPSSRLSN